MAIKVIKNVDLTDLDLSVRAWNCLRRAKIDNVQDIVDNIDNLPKVRNLGQKCHNEVLDKIKPYVEVVDKIQMADGYADALVERTKAEAIKEFADKLPEIIPHFDDGHTTMECVVRAVKNLVKELTNKN